MYLHLTEMKGHRDELKCVQWFIASLNLKEHQFVFRHDPAKLPGAQLSRGQALLQPVQPKSEQNNPAGIHRQTEGF